MKVSFSERYGLVPKKALQIDRMDEELGTSLWICLEHLFENISADSHEYRISKEHYRGFLEFIWTEFFKRPKSILIGVNNHHIIHSHIKPLYNKGSWDYVYSFIEFVASCVGYISGNYPPQFKEECNRILERESSGWRFVNDEIVPVTEPREIQCIEDAFGDIGNETTRHLNDAIRYLSEKGEKEKYRECCKASIDALEAYAQEVTGETGVALSEICKKRKLPLHPTKQKSIQHLYDYASDHFRHAIKPGDQEITFEDAKCMLIECSNHINLIKSKRKR